MTRCPWCNGVITEDDMDTPRVVQNPAGDWEHAFMCCDSSADIWDDWPDEEEGRQ